MDLQSTAQLLGNFGEFLGSLGVIVTLIYLAIQIRSNTSATRANASFQATHSWGEVTQRLAGLPDDQFGPITKLFKADMAPDDLTPEEYERVRLTCRNIYQRLEGQYYLFKYGLLEPGVWEVRSAIGAGMVKANPLLREWWETDTNPLNYSREFVEVINNTSPINATELSRPPSAGP
jgi:hypothetical protein